MSNEALDFVRHVFAVWIGGRIDEFAEMLDPGLTWDLTAHPLPDFPDTGSGRGPFLHHLAHYAEGWSNYEVALREALQVGDDVLCVLHERVTMGSSDTVLDRELVLVWTVDSERLTHFRAFPTRETALAALGAA